MSLVLGWHFLKRFIECVWRGLPAFLCCRLFETTPFIEEWNLCLKPRLLDVEHEKRQNCGDG